MHLEAGHGGRKKSVQKPKQGKLLWREQGEDSVLESQIGCVEGWWVGSSLALDGGGGAACWFGKQGLEICFFLPRGIVSGY